MALSRYGSSPGTSVVSGGLLRTLCISAEDRDTAMGSPVDNHDSLVTYRGRYRSYFQEAPVFDLLLLDEGAPRSIIYQVARLQEHVTALPKKATVTHLSAEERFILEALTMLRLVDLDRLLLVPQGKEDQEGLGPLLARLGYLLRSLSEAITFSYFRQTELPQQLVDIQ